MEVRMSLHIRETAGDGVRWYAPVMPLVGRRLNSMKASISGHYTQNFHTVKRMRKAAEDFHPGARWRVANRQKFLPGETDWTKDFRLLSCGVIVPNMEQLMATSPSMLALAGPPVDYSRRLELIGVQPVELADFCSGWSNGVMRQIKPAIGMVLACLVLKSVTFLHRLAAG